MFLSEKNFEGLKESDGVLQDRELTTRIGIGGWPKSERHVLNQMFVVVRKHKVQEQSRGGRGR